MTSDKETGFFGFLLDARKDEPLLEKFYKIKTLKELKVFFKEDNPLYGLSNAELDLIWEERQNLCNNPGTRKEILEIICGGRGY